MKNKLLAFILTVVCFISVGNAYAQSTKIVEQKENGKTLKMVDVENQQEAEPLKSYIQEGYKGVLDTYNKMMIGYINENLDQVLSTIADDKNVVFFGTGEKYILIGKDNIKKAFKLDFKAFEDTDISVPWISISGKDNVAWVSALVEMSLKMEGKETQINARQTMVLEKVGDEWKIVNSHFSFPAMEEQVSSVDKVEIKDETGKNKE